MVKSAQKKNAILEDIAGYSPYLARLQNLPLEDFESFTQPIALGTPLDDIMDTLRQRKKSVAWLLAYHDITEIWDEIKVMELLSRFADFCVREALRHLLYEAHRKNTLQLIDSDQPEKNSGVSIIALGKWGAHELNYSSDIDFMVLFDPDMAPLADPHDAQKFYTRLTRTLSRILDQHTAEGYVFRTDLRLRPDPGATPLAVSISTAERYYFSVGQNWERAALIKARPVAGDPRLSDRFKALMKNWIWRRNLDFDTIQDIHSIKRQINARHTNPKNTAPHFAEYNVKLGHGGIREIEFFAQTQQLIYGGKEPDLRVSGTLSALQTLNQHQYITDKTEQKLNDAYLFLRRIEHRLQMQNDFQTHTLPADHEDLEKFALFCGYDQLDHLFEDLKEHTDHVKAAYAHVFTDSPPLSNPGNLVFTGIEDDPETLVTLKEIGFKDPSHVTQRIRNWHHGRTRATRSIRARQILTEIIPHLLSVFGKTHDPDEAFIKFDSFLEQLPDGVSIFSLFSHNPDLMTLVADIMGSAPMLADYMSRHPQVLDSILDKNFYTALPNQDTLKNELHKHLKQARNYEDKLNITRRFTHEKMFQVGVHILRDISPAQACARAYADIAQVSLSILLTHVECEFEKQHGMIENGRYILIGLGSLGARLMYADSDLDLVALYQAPDQLMQSNGDKPLTPSVYYTRMTQRLITALTAATHEGQLYQPDFRLRPHGNKGPLATEIDGYLEYQSQSAWAWEHMSLIRARVIYGDTAVQAELEGMINSILIQKRDSKELVDAFQAMRRLLTKQRGTSNIWDLHNVPGGKMDIVLTTHYLILQHTHKHQDIIHSSIPLCLDALREKKLLSDDNYQSLRAAYDVIVRTTSLLRLCAQNPFQPEKASPAVKQIIAQRIIPEATFEAAQSTLEAVCAASDQACQNIMAHACTS